MKINIKTLLTAVGLPLLGGAVTALLTSGSMRAFENINKPSFSPPGWLFPVAWTVLYILMGIASYIIAVSGNEKSPAAIKAYGAQLIFNLLWTFWFFELEAYWFSFAWVLALIALVIITLVRFYRISKPAAYLLIPYILWLIFAAILNLAIALMN